MPVTSMKVKSGKKYDVKYKVSGSLDSMTSDQLKVFAVRYLRTVARNFVLNKLNEAEPAIVSNKTMMEAMIQSGLGTPEQAQLFFKNMNMPLEIPTEFDIEISSLLPSEGSRGKKAADIFSWEEPEEEEEEEVTE